jgi:hypothetical protein
LPVPNKANDKSKVKTQKSKGKSANPVMTMGAIFATLAKQR